MKKTKPKIKKFAYRHIVKRHGHKEKFDERKIYASVYEAAHVAQLPTKQAEEIAASVTLSIKKWVEKKDLHNAKEIHRETVKELKKHHAEVAFMYETHKDIC
jgi:transcriptional regulator NrdR family protein